LFLCIELLPLLLEDLPADALVLLNAVRIELPSALPAFHQFIRAILFDLSPVFAVDLLDTLFFISLFLLRVGLLVGRHFDGGFVPFSSLLVSRLLVVLCRSLRFALVGWVLLAVRIFVGVAWIASPAYVLAITIAILIVVAVKIYFKAELLLGLGFPRG
jgi:hypothetical protein